MPPSSPEPQRDEVVLDARGPWAPRVLRRGDRLLWEMYVASGHADRIEELPLQPRHGEVLRAEPVRYWLLLAALHHPYQLAETRLSDRELRGYLDTLLLGSRADAGAFLTRLDHGRANGAVSNLLRIHTGADHPTLRAGRWWEALEAVLPAG